jgi:membrane protease YdiL (CAAX protease family)
MKSKLLSFTRGHPVLSYYVLVFIVSWGGGLLALGPGGLMGTTVTPRTQLLVNVPIGIMGPCIAGLLMTTVLYGRNGLRALLSRLTKWRVGIGWYAFAILTAPVISTASLLARSTPPAIATASNKLALLLMGIAIGIGTSPFFEEIGWTGFATPELRKRFGVLGTGLFIGVLWGVWHFPAFSATGRTSEPLSPVVFTVALLFTWLIPYRVLMVWLYDHTHSLLLAMIMHVPIVMEKFILYPSESSSTFTAISNVIEAAALWVVVAVVFLASRNRLEMLTVPRGRSTTGS